MFCIVTVVHVHVLYCDSGTLYMFCIVTVVHCTCFVLWQWYIVHVLYCDSGTCTCFILWQWYIVHVLYCGSGTCTCFVLWQRYAYMFCIAIVARERVLYCDSGTREKSLKNTALRDHFCFLLLPFPVHSSYWLRAGSRSSKLPCIFLATFLATFL